MVAEPEAVVVVGWQTVAGAVASVARLVPFVVELPVLETGQP